VGGGELTVSSDIGVGDSELAFLDVEPADGGTQVTLTVDPPTGSPFPITMTAGALVAIPDTSPVQYTCRFTADTPVAYDQAGRWILHYEVTGTGEGAEDLEVFVVESPVAGGPVWTPGRSRVANYVPHRTLVRSTSTGLGSDDAYAYTFDSTTLPTGIQLDRIIADGVAWITARTSPTLNAGLAEAASVCVTLFAAAMVERNWPEDGTALQRATDLERRLDIMIRDLVDANNVANGTGDYGIEILPMWTFPVADPRWDYSCYW
jgi:hypothetical protein